MRALSLAQFGDHFLRPAQYVFASIGIVALGYWACVSVNAHIFQSKETQNFAQEMHKQASQRKMDMQSPSAGEVVQQGPANGAVIARLAIPRLGLSTMVVEGVEDNDLKLGAGHIPGTPLPGESGNVGIAAHRDTFFRPLRLIHKSDVIAITTLRGEDRYQVVSTEIVSPDDIKVLYPTGRDTLTLVTCYPFYFVGSAPQRFIVRAQRSGEQESSAAKEPSKIAPVTIKNNSPRLITSEPEQEVEIWDINRQVQRK